MMTNPVSRALCAISESDCQRFLHEMRTMKRGNSHGLPAPHKPLLLLAVIALIEEGAISPLRIEFDERLNEMFDGLFTSLNGPYDYRSAAEPYWHLRSSPFWIHCVVPDREADYEQTATSGGGRRRIKEMIQYAYLADYAAQSVLDERCRKEVKVALWEMV
jgi:predicted restriction endonuclease